MVNFVNKLYVFSIKKNDPLLYDYWLSILVFIEHIPLFYKWKMLEHIIVLYVFGYKTIITQIRVTARTKAGSYSKWWLGRGILGRRMKFKDF